MSRSPRGRRVALCVSVTLAAVLVSTSTSPAASADDAPSTPSPGDRLAAGVGLSAGQSLSLSDGYRLVMQGDGNLVLYAPSRPVWSTGTAANPGASVVMQGDGNLVVYSTSGRPLWNTGTNGTGTSLVLQSDHNVVLYQGDGQPLWSWMTGRIAPPVSGDTLYPGQTMRAGQAVRSGTEYQAVMQGDGNLVVYSPRGPLWSSGTSGHAGAVAVLQADGNLVIYQGATPLANTGTSAAGRGTFARIQPDGNFVLYNAAGTPLWNTGVDPARSPGSSDPATPAPPAPPSAASFLDDFDGPAGALANSALWAYQTGGNWGNGSELQQTTNRAANASLTGNGTLMITAQGETYTGWDHITRQYTSARLMSKPSVLYGKVQARIRMSGSPGAWPAFWTMGANYAQVGWPACGELDVMEAVNSFPNLYGSFHGPVAGAVRGTSYNQGRMLSVPGGLAGSWHTYEADWTPTNVTFLLDGVPYSTISRAAMPANQVWALDNPQNIILNIAVGGSMPGPGVAAPAAFRATMEVDWVKVTPLS